MALAAYAKVKGIAIVNEQARLNKLDVVAEWSSNHKDPLIVTNVLALGTCLPIWLML